MALTISDKKISLWIAGNQFDSKGFESLVQIKPQFPALTLDGMPGVEANPYYFVINISPEYTQYTLVCNKVTTADGQEGGVLKIAIAIPRNHRIVGGFTSPFDVLAKLREVFVGTYMTPTPGTKEAYTYKSDRPSEAVFANILNGYNLEETHMVHRPMQGTEAALAVLSPADIKRLFKDVQYQEFTPYKDVIVATFADETAFGDRVLRGLEVPRRPKFKLFVNSEEVPWPVKDIFNDMITLRSNADDKFYINRSVTFTVNDLMNGKTYRGITMDLAKEEIRVRLEAEPRKNIYRIDLEGAGTERHHINQVKITCNGKPVTVVNGQFTLTGEEIQFKNTLGVAYEGSDYKISDKKWYGDTLRITLRPTAPAATPAAPAPVEAKAPKTQASAPATAPAATAAASASAQAAGVTTVKAVVDSTMSQGYWYLVIECGSANMIDKSLRERVTFSRDTTAKGKRGDFVSNPIEVPETWTNRGVNLHLESDKDRTNSVHKTLTRGENMVTFTDIEPRNTMQKLLPTLLLSLIALVVGFLIGWFVGRPADATDKADTIEEPENTEVTTGDDSAAESKVETAPATDLFTLNLDDINLTFAKVKDAYKQASASSKPGVDMEKLSALNAIVTAIEAKNVDDIKKLADDKNTPLAYDQLWAVREIYKGWKDSDGLHEYTAQSIDQARKEFANATYASFADLTSLHNGKGEYKAGSQALNKKEAAKSGKSDDKKADAKKADDKKADSKSDKSDDKKSESKKQD